MIIDVTCYLYLPVKIANKLDGYRPHADMFGGRGTYPRHYFESHAARGFDIRPNAHGTHIVEGLAYPIWSNSLGCFDNEWKDVPTAYYYFAGDSQTWGYSPFNDRFTAIFENTTGIPSLKCGVTHSGQRHQFDKFLDIVQKIGHMPNRVILGYSANDIANDYAYPHSTVIDGWLVDNVFLDVKDFSLVDIDKMWLTEQVLQRLKQQQASQKLSMDLVKQKLRQYSLSYHVVRYIFRFVKGKLVSTSLVSVDDEPLISYKGYMLKSVYALNKEHQDGGRYRYAETKFTAPNRGALLAWQAHARQNGYNLTLILIPIHHYHDLVGFYVELKEFLDQHGIGYIDLFEEFRAGGFDPAQVYWPYDGHMSPFGNRLVAEILVRRLGVERRHVDGDGRSGN